MADVQAPLEWLDPTWLSRDEWVSVGMAMHEEGLTLDDWKAWSSRDTRDRKHGYNEADAEKVWRSFRPGGGTTGGTLIKIAKDHGWDPIGGMRVYGWDEEFMVFSEAPKPKQTPRPQPEREPTEQVIDPTWVESAELVEPGSDWQPAKDMAGYLSALFEPEDRVGYVVNATERDGRLTPADKGNYKDRCGRILDDLEKHPEDTTYAIGTTDANAGAWVRLNPLDGEGVRNENVTEFRYALVECDDMPQAKQLALIRALNLPCAAIVDSGGKSVHAVVKVGARDLAEYRERVDFLFRTCMDNGLKVDTQNKNPSRLTRLPGVMRNGRKQWLIGTDEGARNWAEWREWLAEQNDDLPEPENLASVWDDMPELSPPLIEGVLRQGHKMLLAGPSKAGKSFALIELCIAIAEGSEWMGFGCAQGRVMYVNLELDRASCLHRFRDVYAGLGLEPENLANIDVWNLRGKGKPMDQLAPALIRRAARSKPIAIVLDPIYKVITGDENSADQMAAFCNQFDLVADGLGCSVIYCHHHSKGSQGQKRSMDRASGSGVFARDPDALLDVIELHVPDEEREPGLTAWRIEGTLREFPSFEPVEAWFDYPIHRLDGDGRLKQMQPEGELTDRAEYRARGREKKAANDAKRQGGKLQALREGMQRCAVDGVEPTLVNTVERMPEVGGKVPTVGQVRGWVKPGKNEWCPIALEGEKGMPGVLVDPELKDMLEGW